ncbi:MAG: enoyl-CoA hydratase-related protein [Burkholderiaceae bacterium]|uniref:enoyl-CoA hydratase/isomerase family protein n=1 Tax=Polaromonas sp. TaxID=1869339 RepID=UPI002728E675|nr:enoyl-CoA hydratase-related protein [Polaromonas sp.]MDO8777891.1 enoyl-CoA hydratase-related protein [Burkholderiaceae bacterium]MDP2451354.1 enoyl-CoA hydratase-related protein [Polaromonas sp.]MDP3828299.1 enoyl-CoA hydratase-related protein [Polaromonas sp.]
MSEVRYEQQGAIVQITIDRSAQLNAINEGVRKRLYEAFERFEADESAYAAILTGSGGNAFCASMDLMEAASRRGGSFRSLATA